MPLSKARMREGKRQDRADVKPKRMCWICKSTDWWWRPDSRWGKGEWLCKTCHPNPNLVEALCP